MGYSHPDVTPELVQEWRELREQGYNWAEITRKYKFKFCFSTIKRYAEGKEIKHAPRLHKPRYEVVDGDHWYAPTYVRQGNTVKYSHRALWEYERPEPLPTYLTRTCDDPKCRNPWHYEPQSKVGRNTIDKYTLHRMQVLFEQGVHPKAIAERLGVCTATVRRKLVKDVYERGTLSDCSPRVIEAVRRYAHRVKYSRRHRKLTESEVRELYRTIHAMRDAGVSTNSIRAALHVGWDACRSAFDLSEDEFVRTKYTQGRTNEKPQE